MPVSDNAELLNRNKGDFVPASRPDIVKSGRPPLLGRDQAEANMLRIGCLAAALLAGMIGTASADGPDLIFRQSTKWRLLTPNDRLATYAIDDPVVDGVACFFTVPEKGGISGSLGFAEEVSDISLACRQIGPISFKEITEQGDVVLRQSRSFFFKRMQIVRGCDTKRNTLVYMVYSDKLIEGSPKNSTSAVPIQPWGNGTEAPKCADWTKS